MKKGDIILVLFPFTDLQGVKRRPAVVLFSGERDTIAAFITSKVKAEDNFELSVTPNSKNGLKRNSIVKLNKPATLDLSLISGKIGSLDGTEVLEIDKQLKLMLGL